MKTLPDMIFDLPEWTESQLRPVRQAQERLETIGSKVGKGSDEFKNSCRKLLEAALTGQGKKIDRYIESAIDCRAFTFLLSSQEKFSRHVRISLSLLNHLLFVRSPLTRLTLTQMISAFMTHYDQLTNDGGIVEWCHYIKHQLAQVSSEKGSSELQKHAQFADVIFSPGGPSQVIAYAKQENLDLDGAAKRMGLNVVAGGRFMTLCRYRYYLETLKGIPVGDDHSVLAEVCKSEVANAPYTADKLIGHAILEILIDRSKGRAISPSWQRVILTIAGDPRVPKSSRNYQQWWALLGDKRIALMRGWLSRFDLKLFLKVLEQSAKDGSHRDMERMFESRKVFMEGLLKQGLVLESRLFLSRHAESYLKSHYDRKELPEYASVVSSQHTSMIYLNLSGKVHMIEGSHSFKLKLFNHLPRAVKIADYGVKTFADRDLRSKIVAQYHQDYSSAEGCRDLTHDVHLNWQHKAISYFQKMGLPVNAAELINKNRYREYKYKFGVL